MWKHEFVHFHSFEPLSLAEATTALLSVMIKYRRFITLSYHCLCLGSWRNEIEVFIVAAVSEAIAHTYTACESWKLFSCGVWSVYASFPLCVSCIEWLYVCVARGFTSTSLYPLCKNVQNVSYVLFSLLSLSTPCSYPSTTPLPLWPSISIHIMGMHLIINGGACLYGSLPR